MQKQEKGKDREISRRKSYNIFSDFLESFILAPNLHLRMC